MSKRYDIFISYRRVSFDIANLIAMKLTAAGYSVFVDIETLHAGKFNERLLEVIEGCKDFILVLPPNALERCNSENDWVRCEVEHALKHKKNIIPVMLRNFEWPASEALPASLRDLPMYNGVMINDANLFVDTIERIKRNFLVSRPRSRVLRITVYVVIAVAIVAILLCMLLCKGSENRAKVAPDKPSDEQVEVSQEVEMVCNEHAVQLMNLYMLSDINMQLLDKVYKSWDRHLVKRQPTDDNINDFVLDVAMFRQQLHSMPTLYIFDSDYALLDNLGISAKDIERFEGSVKVLHTELCDHLDTLKHIASSPTVYGDYIEISKQYYMAMLEYSYYILLEIFSKMPESVYDNVYDTTISLEYFTDRSMRDKTEEYQRIQKNLKNVIETKRRSMLGMVD